MQAYTDSVRAGLRSRIESFTCSSRWADDLVELIGDPPPRSTAAVKRTLLSAKAYPPGGSRTSMILCPACARWTPRNHGEGGDATCLDCHYELMSDQHAAQLPSANRFEWPQPVAHIKSSLATGILRLRQSRSIIRPRSSTSWFAEKEAGLVLLAQADRAGRSRRPLYLKDDPRICGGPIDVDGVMHDPHLGDSASPITITITAAAA